MRNKKQEQDRRATRLASQSERWLNGNIKLVDMVTGKSGSGNVRPIGAGGSGVVFKANQVLHETVGIDRAVKFFIYRDDVADIQNISDRTPISETEFLEEVSSIARLGHTNLLKVIDAGIAESDGVNESQAGIPYIVTEYVDGPSLQELIDFGENGEGSHLQTNELTGRTAKQNSYSLIALEYFAENPSSALEFLLQIASALAYMHGQEVAHCDIAPKNIFLRMRGEQEPPMPIVGDLGTAKSLHPRDGHVRMVGTRNYMPPEILEFWNKRIPHAQFRSYQPQWDIYGFAKSALAFVNSIPYENSPAWMDPLIEECLSSAEAGTKYTDFISLEERIRFFLPMHLPRGGVQELAPIISRARRRLMPISSLAVTRRVDRLLHHPALLRLQLVPQITAVASLIPGGQHDRYEHSLGVMETMRQFLNVLLDRPQFIRFLSAENIELALLSALLYNITRFPLSNVVHEIRKDGWREDGRLFRKLSTSYLLERQFAVKDKEGATILDVINEDFPRVDAIDLRNILLDEHKNIKEHKLICSFLSSTLDARVIDFVRRDAMHIGMASGSFISIEDLLPHLTTHEDRLAIQSTGVSIAEQIVALRYWLYQRVYWNRVNRGICALIRRAIMTALEHDEKFGDSLSKVVMKKNEKQLVQYLANKLKKIGDGRLARLVANYAYTGEHDFIALLDVSKREDARLISKISKMENKKFDILNDRLQKMLREKGYKGYVLADYTSEYGNLKLGDDIMVVHRTAGAEPLDRYSSIVKGVNENFTEHLQRFRMFVEYAEWRRFKKAVPNYDSRGRVESVLTEMVFDAISEIESR